MILIIHQNHQIDLNWILWNLLDPVSLLCFFLGSAFTIFILSIPFSKPPIYENVNCIEYILETLYKSGFDSIYSLITILLRSNSLGSEKSCQIILTLLANEENQSHFLENNHFCQVIYKYTSVIASQEIEMLVAHKAL